MTEHERYDLVLEIGEKLHRIQCKWGRLDRGGDIIVVNLTSSRTTPNGYVRTRYEFGEIDFVAVYCGAVDRCYLLPERVFLGKGCVQLRLAETRNGQVSCI